MLVRQYGVLAPAVLEYIPAEAPANLSRLDAARLKYAVQHEMAQYARDFLEVSTTLAHEGRAALLPPGCGVRASRSE